MDILYPIILAVTGSDRQLQGREKVVRLSGLARCALYVSADRSGIELGELLKSPEGKPLPADGFFWSLSHKPEYVAGVVADFPVGIDIEKIRPCSHGLYRMIAEESEWELATPVTDRLFFRYWTAKETVLKSFGVGMKGLSRCRVIRIVDERFMTLSYNHQQIHVEHLYFDNHIAAVICHPDVRWSILSL